MGLLNVRPGDARFSCNSYPSNGYDRLTRLCTSFLTAWQSMTVLYSNPFDMRTVRSMGNVIEAFECQAEYQNFDSASEALWHVHLALPQLGMSDLDRTGSDYSDVPMDDYPELTRNMLTVLQQFNEGRLICPVGLRKDREPELAHLVVHSILLVAIFREWRHRLQTPLWPSYLIESADPAGVGLTARVLGWWLVQSSIVDGQCSFELQDSNEQCVCLSAAKV
eukprot:TRINITY_DN28202_c0_g1_i1.p1 TRINITY_DN28202_c0_g1~~TRINITY_DN28202_c0_g1_i1.p1  ORF type:complete len:222 (+),score=15.19 TRINITY_DN28202_c0_g1_i1:22-687(+)